MLKSFNSKILLFSFLASGGLPWGIPVHSQHQGYEGWYPTLTLTLTSLLHFCPTLWVCTQHERSWKRKKTYLLHLCPTQVIHTIRDTPPNPSGLLALSTDSSHCYLAYPGTWIPGYLDTYRVSLKKRSLRDWHPKWFQGQPVKMCIMFLPIGPSIW